MKNDKLIERERYSERAKDFIHELINGNKLVDGAEGVVLSIRKPYIEYESLLLSHLSSLKLVLELGAGSGSFTGLLLRTGANIYATDIAPEALQALEVRYKGIGHLVTQVADIECLPFENEKFDIVTSAGSLSYGDNILVMNEIFRVLKPGGIFVCVDSLNHNLIYRFNRWVHFLRGRRTKSTLTRMPTLALIEKYRTLFGYIHIQFFGSCSWATPIFAAILGQKITAHMSDWLDEIISVRKSAFKFVMMARKEN